MPHEWNNRIVVTKDELIPAFFPSWDSLKVKLYRDSKKPYGIRRAQRGGGLNCEVLIDFDTLPEKIREKLGDPRRVDCILERYYWEDGAAVTYFANLKVGKKGYITPERQRDYVLESSVLMAAIRLRAARLEECAARGISIKYMDKFISEAVNNFNEFRRLKQLPCHNLPTNHLSLRRKIERFEKEGYTSLLLRYDNANAARKTQKVMNLLNALYVRKEKPTLVEVFRLYEGFLNGKVEVINPETGEMYDPKEYSKISERTATTFLSSWKEKVATHLKRSSNRQQYMSKYDPYQTLRQPEYAGSIISIDDRQPPFEYERSTRMWFYNGIDLGSECIIAFVWGKTKEGIILEFYRELVRNCAEWGVSLPAELECESSLNSLYRDTFLREGCMFRYVRILANSARSKRIERYYGNLRYQYEKRRSGWIGRPQAQNEAYQRGSDRPELVPYDTLVRNCLEDIMEWNNSPHSKYPDKTRWEIFREKQHPDLQPINWRGILPYLGERTLTSCRAGQIRLNREMFLLGDNGEIFTGDPLIELMSRIEGKEVEVYWIRGHQGEVLKALVYLKGRCMCEALPKPIAKRSRLEAQDDSEAERNFKLVECYKNTVRGWARQHKNEIEDLIVIDNRQRTLNDGFRINWVDGLGTTSGESPSEPLPLEDPDGDTGLAGDEPAGSYIRPMSERY